MVEEAVPFLPASGDAIAVSSCSRDFFGDTGAVLDDAAKGNGRWCSGR